MNQLSFTVTNALEGKEQETKKPELQLGELPTSHLEKPVLPPSILPDLAPPVPMKESTVKDNWNQGYLWDKLET